MFQLLVQRRYVIDFIKFAIDLEALEALLAQLRHFLAILTLAATHDRRQQVKPGAFFHLENQVDHLADSLALDRQAGRGRVGDTDPGIEKPQIIVDLRHRANRGARVPGRCLLLDGDRR